MYEVRQLRYLLFILALAVLIEDTIIFKISVPSLISSVILSLKLKLNSRNNSRK